MPTFCIGRETIEALAKGGPVAVGQDCCVIPSDSYDAPYKRISNLEAVLSEIRREAEGVNYLNSPQTSCARIAGLVNAVLPDCESK